MGKTFKDKANYYVHHLEHDNPYALKKEKHRIAQADIPNDVKPMVEKLQYNYNAGLRHGNNRKMYSDMKVVERRHKRAQDKSDLQYQVNHL